MKTLEPVHEKAIDLLVAGKNQTETALLIGVNPRTLRRWIDEEKFRAELTRQHQLAREFHRAAAAEEEREERELRKLGRQRIRKILEDENAKPAELIECLKVLQRGEQIEKREEQAQKWREFVYFDKKQERIELATAGRAAEQAHREKWTYNRITEEARKLVIARQDECMQFLAVEEAARAAAGKSGQPNEKGEPCPPPVAMLTPEEALTWTARANRPFQYPPQKADKTGHVELVAAKHAAVPV